MNISKNHFLLIKLVQIVCNAGVVGCVANYSPGFLSVFVAEAVPMYKLELLHMASETFLAVNISGLFNYFMDTPWHSYVRIFSLVTQEAITVASLAYYCQMFALARVYLHRDATIIGLLVILVLLYAIEITLVKMQSNEGSVISKQAKDTNPDNQSSIEPVPDP